MIDKLKQIWKSITELPFLSSFLRWTKRYSLPGFAGVPIYNIVVFIYNETLKDNITTRANSIAFSLFIALFPFIIFLFTLIPYLNEMLPGMANPIDLLRENLETVLPNNANRYLLNIVEDVVGIQREGLLSFGFALAIFFASSGVLTMMYGFDKTYKKTFKSRSYLRMRFVALNLTILLGLLFIFSFVLLIIGPTIMNFLDGIFDLAAGWLIIIKLLRYLIGILLVYTGITIIYRYGPSMHHRIPFINPGAMLATLLSIITSVGFSYFVNNFGRYNELYGSIGALIVLMLWLQFNAFVILIGYELDASIAVNRDLLLEETSEPDNFMEV